MESKDGSLGIFTKRLVNNDQQILVGSVDTYMAVSRNNYLKLNEKTNKKKNQFDMSKLDNLSQQIYY